MPVILAINKYKFSLRHKIINFLLTGTSDFGIITDKISSITEKTENTIISQFKGSSGS